MKEFYDAVVVGGGPAGLAAALYLARAQYQVLVVEKEKIGGQITITSEVVNYPGIPMTDGTQLTEGMRRQAENFGADFLIANVTSTELEGDEKKVYTDKGTIRTLGIILATGASPREAGFQGEKEFRGRGVAYCATCDGEFFSGKDVFVVGGGFAAAEEGIFLTKYARKVVLLVREDDFTCAGSIVDEVRSHPDIEVRYRTEIQEVGGDGYLQYAVIHQNETGETYRYEPEGGGTFGLFVFAGYVPANELFRDKLELNEAGYLITDVNQKTSVEGVYGAGDICVKNLRQVVTAVSDGAVAATSMEKHLFHMYRKLGLEKKEKPVKKAVHAAAVEESNSDEGFITRQMKETLKPVFERFQNNVIVKVYLDDSPLSREVEHFTEEMEGLCDRIQFEKKKEKTEGITYPSLSICNAKGEALGVEFHGVPGGHEFNSFIIALYNAAGPGQAIDVALLQKIRELDKETHIRIAVSLSCTMCPDLVMAAQRIALENEKVKTEMYDLGHYPELKEKYQIMSVPCMIINDEKVYFGKKNIPELLDILS